MSEGVYRIRRYSGRAGGSNHYHHADVIATHWTRALKAAREGRVRNWRWIDTYDTSDTTYESFRFLYRVDGSEIRLPARPEASDE